MRRQYQSVILSGAGGGGGGAPTPTTAPVYEGRQGWISTTGLMGGINTVTLSLADEEGDYAIVASMFESDGVVSLAADDSFELLASGVADNSAFYVHKLTYNGTDGTVSLNSTSTTSITAGFHDAVRFSNAGVPQIVAPMETMTAGDATQVGDNFTMNSASIQHSVDAPAFSGTNWALDFICMVGDDGNWSIPTGYTRSQSSSTSGSDAAVAQLMDEAPSASLDGSTIFSSNSDMNAWDSAAILLAIPGLT